jgi:hypothetical protein
MATRRLLVTKEAIAEYWLQNAFVPPSLGIVVLAGLPRKAHCKVLETLVGASRENLTCLTDLSPDGVRTLLMLERQLRDVRASFAGVSDDMLQAVGFPLNALLKESGAFTIDGPELDDVRLVLKENPHLESLLGECCIDLLRNGRAVDVVALFIESPNERSIAHDRFTALLKYRAPRLAAE